MSDLIDRQQAVAAIRAAVEPYLTNAGKFVMSGPGGVAMAAVNAVNGVPEAKRGALRIAAQQDGAWQPIKTAPKQKYVLVCNDIGNVHVAKYGMRFLGDPGPEAWCVEGKWVGGHVTHWRPLPDLPATHEQNPTR